MTATPPLPGLLADLAGELDGLLAELREEAELLTAGQADGLPALLDRKAPRLARVARLWQALTAALGLGPDADVARLGERLAQRPEAGSAQVWPSIAARAREAARQNQANGLMIQEQMRHAQAALGVLRDAARRGGLYGADGQALAVFSNPRKIDEV